MNNAGKFEVTQPFAKGRVTRTVVAGTLALTMAAMPFTGVSMAFADDGTPGTIIINQPTGQTAATFSAYKLFTADVAAGAGNTASNVQWASEPAKQAVLTAIKSFDSAQDTTKMTAQDAAEYISKHIGDPAPSTDNTYLTASGTLGKVLANSVKEKMTAESTEVSSGTAASFADGYYLFVNKTTGNAATDAGTAPIFALLGGDAVTVTAKSALPTVTKLNKSDATGEWGTVTDAEIGQTIEYKLTGTVASNISTFDSYKYIFHDHVSQGLTVDLNSVKVMIGDVDVTSSFKSALASQDLTVSIDDLKSITTADINADTVVTVTYDAVLNSDAVTGGTGNDNTVTLEYSNDPMTDGTGTSTPVINRGYTYKLNLVKQDKQTNVKLAGAKFTIQATNPDDTASKGKYVQADGTLGDTAYEFTTDDNGVIAVSGLDAGTYTLVETEAPAAYNKTPDVTFTIAATYDANMNLTALSNTVAGGVDALMGDQAFAGLGDDEASAVDAAIAADGVVNVTIEDTKTIEMPVTGQQGIMLIGAAGVGIVGISVAALMRRNRREEDASTLA